MSAKTQRQHRIARLLETEEVSSQAQLVELLAADGVTATQATVPRDLEELGAIKVRARGGTAVYAVPELPKDQVAPEEHLRRVLGDWVVEVASSQNLVVLRTPRGRPTWSPRPWTARRCPRCSAPWPATTPSWSSPTRASKDRPWPTSCARWPA